MKPTFLLLAAVAGLGWLAPRNARAQGYEDLDEDTGKAKKKKKARVQVASEEPVREIVKGLYAKANVGGAFYLGQFSGWVHPGTSLGMAVGQDFIDREGHSMAWEVMLYQGIHNGESYEVQAARGCGVAPCVEGDLRTYTLAATLEYAVYPTRRVGLGLRAGGGLLYSPLLMADAAYQSDVVQDSFKDYEPGYHDTPHPLVMGGPNFEYYTKLAHFSVGLDADVFYAIGFDLGASVTGALKYTF